MSCKKFRIEIEEAGGGATLGAAAAAHVAACASCRAFRVERDNLRGLVAGLGRVAAPADFELRLRARIARAEEGGRASFASWSFVPGAAWLAVASSLVLALAVFVHFRQSQMQSQPTASSANPATVKVAQTTLESSNPTAQPPANEELRGVQSAKTTDKAADKAARMMGQTQSVPRRQKSVAPRAGLEEIAKAPPADKALDSNLLSVTGAKIYVGSPIPLPVTTQDRKLEAWFKDTRGAQRVVAVDPVTFGARDRLPQRANMKNVAYTGVW
jgi:hypothetical protein